jgi:transposase InsO family protein
MAHRNAPLTPTGRRLLCREIERGRPIAHVAAEMHISRQRASVWWQRYVAFGEAGLEDRPSTPRRSPQRTDARTERRICELRRKEKLGPHRIAGRLGLNPSTVYAVLRRHQLNRLDRLAPSGRVIRRYEHLAPGDLVHVDVKKLGRIPKGGGWRVHGRSEAVRGRGIGYAFVHAAVDDYSRLAYAEVLDDETGPTSAGFWRRAEAFYRVHGIVVRRVMTDNAKAYLGHHFQAALAETGIAHRPIPPRRPQTNGKVERFNRTLQAEWAYARAYSSDRARTKALDRWLHTYNHHRTHWALGGQPPVSRVNNLAEQYI